MSASGMACQMKSRYAVQRLLAVAMILALPLALLLFACPARADVLVSETFTHDPVMLNGQTPGIGSAWQAHSGEGLWPINVASAEGVGLSAGAAQLNQGLGSREDLHTHFDGGVAAGTGSKLYAGLSVKAEMGSAGSVYFAHFMRDSTALFTGRVGITSNGSSFQFALFSSSDTIEATYPSQCDFYSWYRVIVSYNYDTGLTEMWVNPIVGVDENDPAQVAKVSFTGYAATAVDAFALRQAAMGLADASNTQFIDNLTVATTFAEAVAPVPEPATILAMTAAGLPLLLKRRRMRR